MRTKTNSGWLAPPLANADVRLRDGTWATWLLLAAALTGCGGGGGGDSPPVPTVNAITVGTPRYSQPLLITVDGTQLELLPTVTVAGCAGLTRSTTVPNVSTATRAFYTCTVTDTGASSVNVAYNSATLLSQAFTVPEPQVTLKLTGGASGDIVLTLNPRLVKVTVDNFMRYAADGFYNGTTFHRVISGFVAQGGGFVSPAAPGTRPDAKAPLRPAIALEAGRGLSNVALSVAMARATGADTATSQFFINLVDNSAELDQTTTNPGFAVFGNVSAGAAVVAAVAAAPCGPVAGFSECAPNPPVLIASAQQTR